MSKQWNAWNVLYCPQNYCTTPAFKNALLIKVSTKINLPIMPWVSYLKFDWLYMIPLQNFISILYPDFSIQINFTPEKNDLIVCGVWLCRVRFGSSVRRGFRRWWPRGCLPPSCRLCCWGRRSEGRFGAVVAAAPAVRVVSTMRTTTGSSWCAPVLPPRALGPSVRAASDARVTVPSVSCAPPCSSNVQATMELFFSWKIF